MNLLIFIYRAHLLTPSASIAQHSAIMVRDHGLTLAGREHAQSRPNSIVCSRSNSISAFRLERRLGLGRGAKSLARSADGQRVYRPPGAQERAARVSTSPRR